MSLPSGTKLGPYEIQSPLGAGGMGEVYRARDTRLGRDVAIKVLPAHLSSNPDLRQRMEREAKAISSLNHPYICTLHDVGSQDGVDFLVMEYLEGETLADRVQRGALPLDEALKIGIQIAQALDKAHARGIVHRDLKPANIMLTKNGPKLMDFGLAKPAPGIGSASGDVPLTPSTPTMSVAVLTASASPLTQKGTVVGTFQYMAPEVLQGVEADACSDIFSFGCVLYEMFTGRRAFEGKSQFSVLGAILDKEPERISMMLPDSPPRLDETVWRCLAKSPDQRYGCMHDVRIQLEALAEARAKDSSAQPVSSKPEPASSASAVADRGDRSADRSKYWNGLRLSGAEARPSSAFLDLAAGRHVVRDDAARIGSAGALAGRNAAGIHGAGREKQGPVVCAATEVPDGPATGWNRRCDLSLLVSRRSGDWFLRGGQVEKDQRRRWAASEPVRQRRRTWRCLEQGRCDRVYAIFQRTVI